MNAIKAYLATALRIAQTEYASNPVASEKQKLFYVILGVQSLFKLLNND